MSLVFETSDRQGRSTSTVRVEDARAHTLVQAGLSAVLTGPALEVVAECRRLKTDSVALSPAILHADEVVELRDELTDWLRRVGRDRG